METITKITLCLIASLALTAAMPTKQLSMPANCSNMDYCTEKHELYPQDLVDKMVKTSRLTFTDGKRELKPRVDEGNMERDCEVDITEDPIYEIVDADGDVRIVLQTESDFRQIVSIERCLEPGHIDYPTTHFNLDTVQRFNLSCTQRELAFSFVVLTKDWQDMEMVKPRTDIPIKCDCTLYGKNK